MCLVDHRYMFYMSLLKKHVCAFIDAQKVELGENFKWRRLSKYKRQPRQPSQPQQTALLSCICPFGAGCAPLGAAGGPGAKGAAGPDGCTA